MSPSATSAAQQEEVDESALEVVRDTSVTANLPVGSDAPADPLCKQPVDT